MKKHPLYFILILLSCLSWTWWATASSPKKYRYIKREHGLRFSGKVPVEIGAGLNVGAVLDGAYTYNWKGKIEAGPYFHFDSSIVPFALHSWGSGILGEYNIIKNRGRRKFVPAVGLKIGAFSTNAINLSAGLYGAFKFFVDKRTPFIVSLGCDVQTPVQGMFTSMSYKPYVTMGFSYYFDFY